MTNSYNQFSVGDLIYLTNTKEVGIVLMAVPVEPYKLVAISYNPICPPVDIKVLWSDGHISWCLGEAVIILSPANVM
jgi:hypothetical protein